MRKIFIGDIHGSYYEFLELLKTVKFNKKEDKLILLGDYIDRGKYVYELLEYLIELKKEMKDNLVLIRGNHEDRVINYDDSIKARLIWYLSGKWSTNKSLSEHDKTIMDYKEWLESNTQIYYEDEDIQCCHANIINQHISKNSDDVLMWKHSILGENKYNGYITIVGHHKFKNPRFYDGNGTKYSELIYNVWTPMPRYGVICIDTRGFFIFNKLTAMIIDNDKFYLENQAKIK